MALFNYPKFKAFDSNGNLLVGGKLTTLETGTEQTKDTYSDFEMTVPNTNPVILDSNGEAVIYMDGAYDLILTDADDVQLWTMENISGSGGVVSYGDVVENEVAVFADTSSSIIKGGSDVAIQTGGVILDTGITLHGAGGTTLTVKNTGNAALADISAKNLIVSDITAADIEAANIGGSGNLDLNGDIILGAANVIIRGTAADKVALRNSSDNDYADLYCKNIIASGSGGGSLQLIFDGRTDPPTVLKTNGAMTVAAITCTGFPYINKYRIDITGVNLLTGVTIALNSYGSIDIGPAVSLAKYGGGTFDFHGYLISENPIIPVFPTFTYHSYDGTGGSVPVIDSLTSSYIEFHTDCWHKEFVFYERSPGVFMYDAIIYPPAFPGDAKPSVFTGGACDWISVTINSI